MHCTDIRVLIADGDNRWLDAARRVFSQCGYPVETATDGLECLAKMHEQAPDVLIVEVDIPWGGGDGVVAELSDDSISPKKPAVLVLGDAPPRVLSRRAGVADSCCYQKPIRINQLMNAVRLATGLSSPRQVEYEYDE